ncbi:hypothetical protein AVEN_219467-1 [Araneus ventricosus]|uniref:Uncharacterized protein n=1 Tax=Araneus ventricosus TaxID=182803 RepID=A0A4Y2BPX4_ARAVE|nr:hypothetical protein AVEN_219467-1 [Araneus ventricosus]
MKKSKLPSNYDYLDVSQENDEYIFRMKQIKDEPSALYVNCDKDAMTSKLFTTDESTEDVLSGANLSHDQEVIPSSFKDAMDSIEELRSYFFC